MTTYSVIYEKVNDPSFLPGYYYAYVPAADITTYGLGIEAAGEGVKNWRKKANKEEDPV